MVSTDAVQTTCVSRQREGAGSMRLQAVRIPNALHGRGAHALRARERPTTQMRGGWRRRLCHRGHDALDRGGRDRPVPPSAGRILDQRLRATGGEARAPQQDRETTDPEAFAIALLARSSAANRTTWQRITTLWGALCTRVYVSNRRRSSASITSVSAGSHISRRVAL